jgi:hypothetical protein
MQTSQEVSNLFKALCECKKDFVPLSKNKKGYGYNYTPLDSVIDMLNTVLPKHGINFVQFPSTIGDNYALTTRIFHESGEWMEDTIIFNMTEISKANDTQKLGASITYFRRYALSAIFGIASDEDIDGNIEMNIAAKQSQSQTQPQRKTFNESKPQPQPQPQQQSKPAPQPVSTTNPEKQSEPPKPQPQQQQQQEQTSANIFTNEYNGIPLVDDENINAEIKKLVDEVYLEKQVINDNTKNWILKKKAENTKDFSTKEAYLTFLKRISNANKKKIVDSSVKEEN